MRDSYLTASLLSLASAAVWGTGDFGGGIASKRTNSYTVVIVADAVGILFGLVLAFATGDPFPPTRVIVLSLIAGLSGVVGLVSLYRALSIGTMGINAPVAAVLTAALPVIAGFKTQGLPSSLQLGGFALALVGIWLMALPRGGLRRPRGLGLAILAGFGFGGFLLIVSYAGTTSVFWPTIFSRVTGIGVMVTMLFLTRSSFRITGRDVLPMSVAGIGDAGGTMFFLAATQHGPLALASVLSAFYPATTVLMARLFLSERVSAVQTAGILAALASVPLIASRP
jgi:drug/metabolite transporter (DMT)-like permease